MRCLCCRWTLGHQARSLQVSLQDGATGGVADREYGRAGEATPDMPQEKCEIGLSAEAEGLTGAHRQPAEACVATTREAHVARCSAVRIPAVVVVVVNDSASTRETEVRRHQSVIVQHAHKPIAVAASDQQERRAAAHSDDSERTDLFGRRWRRASRPERGGAASSCKRTQALPPRPQSDPIWPHTSQNGWVAQNGG